MNQECDWSNSEVQDSQKSYSLKQKITSNSAQGNHENKENRGIFTESISRNTSRNKGKGMASSCKDDVLTTDCRTENTPHET